MLFEDNILSSTRKNIGKIGNRIAIELLLIRYKKSFSNDCGFSVYFSYYYGISVEVSCALFIFEISFLPLATYTHSHLSKNDD